MLYFKVLYEPKEERISFPRSVARASGRNAIEHDKIKKKVRLDLKNKYLKKSHTFHV